MIGRGVSFAQEFESGLKRLGLGLTAEQLTELTLSLDSDGNGLVRSLLFLFCRIYNYTNMCGATGMLVLTDIDGGLLWICMYVCRLYVNVGV